MRDVDGNVFIDFLTGAGVLSLGHSHPELVRVAAEQLERHTHGLDFPTPAKDDFVQAQLSMLPDGLRDRMKLHFCGPAGANAVDAAIKLLSPAERAQVDRRCPSCGRPHGKPRLGGRARLHFSVAHAPDLPVFAVQAATPVGVDLEAVAGPGRQPPVPRLLDPQGGRPQAARHRPGDPLHDVRVDLGAPGRAGTRLWATGFDLDATHVGAVATAGPAPTLRIADLPVPPLATPAARW